VAAIVLGTASSRGAATVWAVIGRPSTSPSTGLGSWFASSTTAGSAATSVGSLAILLAGAAFLVGSGVALAGLVGIAVGSALTAGVVAIRGQLDGDGFGALVEMTFASVLVAIVILG
jgi:cobalamin synthase